MTGKTNQDLIVRVRNAIEHHKEIIPGIKVYGEGGPEEGDD